MSMSTSNPVHPLLLSSNLYISEGIDKGLISDIEAMASSFPYVCLLHTFVDSKYHRTGFTLASHDPHHLSHALTQLSLAAIRNIDLRKHLALHPRLGSADHISIHPLMSPHNDIKLGLKEAAECALSVGHGLKTACPVYFYGSAHQQGRRLAEIRRSLGYFKPNLTSPDMQLKQWLGSEPSSSSLSHFPPDMGQLTADEITGVVTIGAVPLILNYNVPLLGSDMTIARLVARSVSERGGGLRGVESMALNHGENGEVIEVACNLLDSDVSPPGAVQLMVHLLVEKINKERSIAEGSSLISVGQGYLTGKSREELIKLAQDKLL